MPPPVKMSLIPTTPLAFGNGVARIQFCLGILLGQENFQLGSSVEAFF